MRGLGPGELLLESFTDADLAAWQRGSSDYQQYHYLWYFELEAQRAAHEAELLDALRKIPGEDVDLTGWGRALHYTYSHTPLSCVGSLKWVGGRFNYGAEIDSTRFPPFPALYLAEDFETGLRELHGLTREETRGGLNAQELSLCSERGLAWVRVEGRVGNIFDFTRISNLKAFTEVIAPFQLSKQVREMEEQMGLKAMTVITDAAHLHSTCMVEGWRAYPAMWSTPSNSQLIGHLSAQAGFEGILYSSTRTGKKNLALFTRQFKNSASIVKVLNPPPTATSCELSANTFNDLESPSC
jgi:hypothetical protein